MLLYYIILLESCTVKQTNKQKAFPQQFCFSMRLTSCNFISTTEDSWFWFPLQSYMPRFIGIQQKNPQCHYIYFFILKRQEQAYSNLFSAHMGLCSAIPLESMHKSRYKYIPTGLMVNDKNGECLGFKTTPAAWHHGAHFKANCTWIF